MADLILAFRVGRRVKQYITFPFVSALRRRSISMQIYPYSFTIIGFKVLFLYRAHVQSSTSPSFARILVCKFELNAVLRMLLNQYSGNKASAPDAFVHKLNLKRS